jgi:nuclear pore complex protein Nup205
VDVLTATLCSDSNKYSDFIAKTFGLSSAEDVILASSDPFTISAAETMWRRFRCVRSMLLSAQRVMVNKGLTKFKFSISDGAIGDERPTLNLFGATAIRLNGELTRLVESRTSALKSIEYNKIVRNVNATESDLIAKLAEIESDIRVLVISTENTLEVLFAHLQPSLRHGEDDSLVVPSLELNGKSQAHDLGILATVMTPSLQSLIRLDKATLGLDTEFLNMIATRVRDSLDSPQQNRFGVA